jgi:hypothetical protein
VCLCLLYKGGVIMPLSLVLYSGGVIVSLSLVQWSFDCVSVYCTIEV